jgi:hypothetical protein
VTEYQINPADTEEYLRQAVEHGHAGTEYALFLRDLSQTEYLAAALDARNADVIFRQATEKETGDLSLIVSLSSVRKHSDTKNQVIVCSKRSRVVLLRRRSSTQGLG